jgi:hypothetical protein
LVTKVLTAPGGFAVVEADALDLDVSAGAEVGVGAEIVGVDGDVAVGAFGLEIEGLLVIMADAGKSPIDDDHGAIEVIPDAASDDGRAAESFVAEVAGGDLREASAALELGDDDVGIAGAFEGGVVLAVDADGVVGGSGDHFSAGRALVVFVGAGVGDQVAAVSGELEVEQVEVP